MSAKTLSSNSDLHLDEEEGEQSSSSLGSFGDPSRDEVKELHNVQKKENNQILAWRMILTVALVVTGVAVTWTTYNALVDEEYTKMVDAFDQFSRTVASAAMEKQQIIRDSVHTFTNIVTSSAVAANATWPLYALPDVEVHWKDLFKTTGMESGALANVVMDKDKAEWEEFAKGGHEAWVKEAHLYNKGNLESLTPVGYFTSITASDGLGGLTLQNRSEFYVPTWSYSPPPYQYSILNSDWMSAPHYASVVRALFALKNETAITGVRQYTTLGVSIKEEEHDAMHTDNINSEPDFPHSFMLAPIHEQLEDTNSPIVSVALFAFAWDAAWRNLLPQGVEGIFAVLHNSCGQAFTYKIDGPDALYLGEGDKHETAYDYYGVVQELSLHSHPRFEATPGHCVYSMSLYPSDEFKALYSSNTPLISAITIAVSFAAVIIIFVVYDLLVRKRNENLIKKAAKSNAVVSNLFPDAIRDKMLGTEDNKSPSNKMKAFLHDGKVAQDRTEKVLADLYLDTTCLFADISSFTSWSSVRDPAQVFKLLETLYQAFDKIAKKRKVFKVETVGDCYVAVVGLPEPNPDHGVVMARFANDILLKMDHLTKVLEVTLGPDTAALGLRVGLHSGPVTAGVLRGDRARFQLFGDTVNTCQRIEHTGKPGRIHCSFETAEILKRSGKEAWLVKRNEGVLAKGKGVLSTYYVNVDGKKSRSISFSATTNGNETLVASSTNCKHLPGLDAKTQRLIDWNVETLLNLMKEIGARRSPKSSLKKVTHRDTNSINLNIQETPLEEVKEIIALPEFDARVAVVDPSLVEIPPIVVEELHHLVSIISTLYNDNPFHNFYHASHVLQSTIKLMSRIVAPPHLLVGTNSKNTAASLHDHTYGITSDPLTPFACAFSALIHDVDHVGVSNAQLVKEGVPIATKYNERSVAEQNSLDLSWDLLMSSKYANLRSYLFPTEADLVRFRQLVVNSVLATDIVDKELKELRNGRWAKAFKGANANSVSSSPHPNLDDDPRDAVNRKATIVIEHIIQASDISHTMQHWHVFRKWNQNLFEELYVAYLNDRMDKDPSDFWYKGEFGFFDFYIIPLTQKLKDCGVFGVSSGEYLDYAKKNRAQWEAQGEEVVAQMVKEAREKYGVKGALKAYGHTERKETPEQAPVQIKSLPDTQVWC